MLTIRREQTEVFRQERLRTFLDSMVPFVSQYFPQQCQQLGDKRIREFVRYGIARARSYGITRKRDVCQYVCLMFIFGGDFDRDGRLKSLQQALQNATIRQNSERMINQLYAAARRDLLRWQQEGRPEWSRPEPE